MKNVIKFLLILLILWPAHVLSQQIPDSTKTAERPENVIPQHQKNEATKQEELSTPPHVIESKSVEQKSASATDKKEDEKKCEFTNRLTTDPIYLLTFFLVAATFGLWWATHRLVTGSENTAKRQLRAYVFVSLADGEKMFHDDKSGCLSAPLIIKNYGQTPAYKMKCNVFIGILKKPLSEQLDPPNYDNGSIGCLASGQVVRQYPTLPRKIDIPERNLILNGTHAIYVWGYLEYMDIFKSTQRVQFRMYSTGEDFAGKELAYCNEGNEAT